MARLPACINEALLGCCRLTSLTALTALLRASRGHSGRDNRKSRGEHQDGDDDSGPFESGEIAEVPYCPCEKIAGRQHDRHPSYRRGDVRYLKSQMAHP